MKKILMTALAAVCIFTIGGCGKDSSKTSSSNLKIIKIGASEIPHSDILKKANEMIKEKGYTLDIKVFDDYVLPNQALANGDLDANFFQTVPYMENANKENEWDLTSVINVHIEPMRIYSPRYKDASSIPNNAKIGVPNDVSNEARALKLLEAQGLIKLDNSVDQPTLKDIKENTKKINFVELDAAMLAGTLDQLDAAVINTNYAVAANLDPNSALAVEAAENSPYINIVAVQEKNKDGDFVKALKEILNSDEMKKYIEDNYGSKGIITAF